MPWNIRQERPIPCRKHCAGGAMCAWGTHHQAHWHAALKPNRPNRETSLLTCHWKTRIGGIAMSSSETAPPFLPLSHRPAIDVDLVLLEAVNRGWWHRRWGLLAALLSSPCRTDTPPLEAVVVENRRLGDQRRLCQAAARDGIVAVSRRLHGNRLPTATANDSANNVDQNRKEQSQRRWTTIWMKAGDAELSNAPISHCVPGVAAAPGRGCIRFSSSH